MGTRKDRKGRVLRTGESQRERYYIYQYTDVTGKRRVIYAKDLPELRIKEKEIRKALEDGLDTYKMATQTLNNAFYAYTGIISQMICIDNEYFIKCII